MLTSPKEESALALVIPRNTCELLSLIKSTAGTECVGKDRGFIIRLLVLRLSLPAHFFLFVCFVIKDTQRASAFV